MKKTYTDEELLIRVLDREEIQDIMNLRVYLCANEQRAEELDRLWVRDPALRKTASFGKNWGFYLGLDSIRDYYVRRHDENLARYRNDYRATRPEAKVNLETLCPGYMTIQPISAPSIQIAGDGKTAKGLWYSVGIQNIPQADGSIQARWIAMKVAADFVKEDKAWHIWHLLEVSDSYWEPGVNYHDEMPVFEDPDNDLLHVEFGTPDIPVQTHDRQFCWADNYPAMPEPYESFCDEISWGPEGFKPFVRWCVK